MWDTYVWYRTRSSKSSSIAHTTSTCASSRHLGRRAKPRSTPSLAPDRGRHNENEQCHRDLRGDGGPRCPESWVFTSSRQSSRQLSVFLFFASFRQSPLDHYGSYANNSRRRKNRIFSWLWGSEKIMCSFACVSGEKIVYCRDISVYCDNVLSRRSIFGDSIMCALDVCHPVVVHSRFHITSTAA